MSGNGLENPTWDKNWIMEKVLNQLITHKNKTKKYVYNETAFKSFVLEENLLEDKFEIDLTIMLRKLLDIR